MRCDSDSSSSATRSTAAEISSLTALMRYLLTSGSCGGRWRDNYITGDTRDSMRRVKRALEFGIAIPQTFLGASIDPAKIRAFLTRAEALGYTGAWVVE